MSSPALLDAVMGRPSSVKLIRAIMNAEEPISGREASRRANVTQRPAVRSLRDLTLSGILRKEITENGYAYSLNREHQLVSHGIVPLFEAEKEHTGASLDDLSRTLKSLAAGSPPDVQSALFIESGALLIVARNQEATARVWNALQRPIEQLEEARGDEVVVHLISTQETLARRDEEEIRVFYREGTLMAGKPLAEIPGAEFLSRPTPTPAVNLGGHRPWLSRFRR